MSAPTRRGHTLNAVNRIEVLCYGCDIRGPAYDLPSFASVGEALGYLAACGWSRATDAEPADVRAYDQQWRCPHCTAEHACHVNGHQPATVPAVTAPGGYRYGAHTACQRCGSWLTRPTMTRPGRVTATRCRIRARLAALARVLDNLCPIPLSDPEF
ncbi:hypothetical protein [Nonomuraea sp. NPDC049141]|uniref:hypothetical protein n=1 Tax=Nonomuraea sp. NPDC049141 TaxID=3155500 RepID=UPI0033EAAD56